MKLSDFQRLVEVESIIKNIKIANLELIIDKLLIFAQNDKNPIIRHEAAFTLAMLNQEYSLDKDRIIDTFETILNTDQSIVVKHEVIEALGFFATEKSVQIITPFLDNENNDLSSTALLSLERIKTENDKNSMD